MGTTINTEIREITPEQAAQMLKRSSVDAYGQHRLMACVQTGVPFTTLVITGIDTETMVAVDQGVRRSLADVLTMNGEVNTNQLASILNGAHAWRMTSTYTTGASTKLTINEALAMLDAEPYTREVAKAINRTNVHASPLRWRPSVAGTLGMELHRHGIDGFDQFVNIVAKPDAVGVQHPAYLLREKFIQWSTSLHHVTTNQMMMAYTVKAWNMWATGQRGKRLYWNPASESMPAIIDSEGNAVSIPGENSRPRRVLPGENNPSAKLSEDDVRSIRRAAEAKSFSPARIAEKYGVDEGSIRKIVKRQTWKHVN